MPTPTIRVSQLPAIDTPADDNLLLVSVLSATVTVTATTISAQASDNSFNDSGSGFGIFAADDQIQVVGFTGNVVNNLFSATVTTATAAKLTIGGAEGDVIVDDAAGESVTITKWDSVRMTLAELAAYLSAAGVDAADVTYTVDDAGNWTGSPVPNRVAAALDELASRMVAVESASSTPVFDVHAFYPGIPTASAIVLRVPLSRAPTFAANFSGSYGVASTASTGTAVFDVQKNGSSIGSITFTSSASATFTTSGGLAQTFAAGDVLSIIAPGTPDATLANVGLALAGTR